MPLIISLIFICIFKSFWTFLFIILSNLFTSCLQSPKSSLNLKSYLGNSLFTSSVNYYQVHCFLGKIWERWNFKCFAVSSGHVTSFIILVTHKKFEILHARQGQRTSPFYFAESLLCLWKWWETNEGLWLHHYTHRHKKRCTWKSNSGKCWRILR